MQDLISEVSRLLAHIFCVDQTSYIEQQSDGKYKRVYGILGFDRIKKSIDSGGSVGSYQRNKDSTVKWICFDFDVAKDYIGENKYGGAINLLNGLVDSFCGNLRELGLSYFLEFSGNRGMHVWLCFNQPIPFSCAYEFSQEILRRSNLPHEAGGGVNIDLFPNNSNPSKGVGFGVKLPLSKHVKSGMYALLLSDNLKSQNAERISDLNSDIIKGQIEILRQYKLVGVDDITRIAPTSMNWDALDRGPILRIESIGLKKRITVDALLRHWERGGELAKLAEQIKVKKSLSHAARRLLVGMLSRVVFQSEKNYGKDLLRSIFSTLDNYDEQTTSDAIAGLVGFNFPTLFQIEAVCGSLSIENCDVQTLVSICIPDVESVSDKVLQITADDVDVVRVAELRYLYQNDEVQCNGVVNNLKLLDKYELLSAVNEMIEGVREPGFYEHFRQEEQKVRRLISQDALTRLATSCVLHQLSCTLNFQPSINSRGYQIAVAFGGGYIFKPWLDLWIDFVGTIQRALEDPENKNFYIVKTDISNFYDNVPQENLKRLMMGDGNRKIELLLSGLSDPQKGRYRTLIEAVFRINEKMTKGNRGLPQGPAYARFLSEVYLDNIDAIFDGRLVSGEVILYQRYVDDIFFICRDEASAQELYGVLSDQVSTLGLGLNSEKTIKSFVRDFDSDFKRFSSQSKYVVDKASKNYENATLTQKNHALNEFLNILQSDSCNEDLAFVFSHLNGVAEVDDIKEGKVVEVLVRAKGRGSMLRHLFTFVFAKASRWKLLLDVTQYDMLQSEVLTTCILQAVNEQGLNNNGLIDVIVNVVPKLESTPLTKENLALLWLMGVPLKGVEPNPSDVMACLMVNADPDLIKLSNESVSKLTVTLNSIVSMREFALCMFPLCISVHTSKTSLNILAQTFYSKLSNDNRLRKLVGSSFPDMAFKRPANRFYQLLCLFSLSKENNDIELLKAAWMVATELTNSVPEFNINFDDDVWFDRLGQVDVSASNNHLVISSVIDGSIYRGGQSDIWRVYEVFHNKIIIHIARQDLDVEFESVKAALERLKAKANFYRWILEREEVSRFPSNAWFERNICENDLILLAKGSEVLVRRPTEKFKVRDNIVGEHNGYGERIVPFQIEKHLSLGKLLEGMQIVEKIDKLVGWLRKYKNDGLFPNFFSQGRLIDSDTHELFLEELSNNNKILFEIPQSRVDVLSNDLSGFVQCFFQLISSGIGNDVAKLFWPKYLSKLPELFDVVNFIELANNEYRQMADVTSNVSLDFAMASALFSSILDSRGERRMSIFVDVYQKFNPLPEDQHVYCVDEASVVNDETPSAIFESLSASFELVSSKVLPVTLFNLGEDLKVYRNEIEAALLVDVPDMVCFQLNDFRKVSVKIQLLTKVIDVSAREYSFEKTFVVNGRMGKVEPYSSISHFYLLSNSEHVYSCERNGSVYLLFLASSISKVFSSLRRRSEAVIGGDKKLRYPGGLTRVSNLSSLVYYDRAVDNIGAQRSIAPSEAKLFLDCWLGGLPEIYRKDLCMLIAAHRVMTADQINEFSKCINEHVAKGNENVFFIKKLDDFNGTQRIIARDPELMRKVAGWGPNRISQLADEATLVVDLVLSGSQIVRALKYYALGEGEYQDYYECGEVGKRDSVAGTLKGLRKLKILQVFHTKDGIDNIKNECRSFLRPDISIEVVGGVDVSQEAFFGTSTALSVHEKDSLRALLGNPDKMKEIFSHLQIPVSAGRKCTDFKGAKIDSVDLIGRYQSLPKRCFYFLHAPILHNENISPFKRTRELYEISLC